MQIYKSKIDWWLGLFFVYPIYRSIVSIIDGEWIGYPVLVFFLLFIVFISKSTRYIIAENQLIVKCMFIVNDRIEISKIRKIEKTNSVLSSPALSLDRIAIYYNKFDEIMVSPKEREDLIKELLKINPNIEVKI